MSFIEVLPDKLKQPGKKNELIAFLRALPIRFHIKKYVLIEYGKLTGEKITFTDIMKLGNIF